MLTPELKGPGHGGLGNGGVVDVRTLLVHEGVLAFVAEQLVIDAAFL